MASKLGWGKVKFFQNTAVLLYLLFERSSHLQISLYKQYLDSFQGPIISKPYIYGIFAHLRLAQTDIEAIVTVMHH